MKSLQSDITNLKPYLDFGYYKYAESKFRDVIVYNRRLNYNEIQELYNSLPVVNEFILDKETLNINEEEYGTFTISLKENPLTTKKVNISTDNQYITVEPSKLILILIIIITHKLSL